MQPHFAILRTEKIKKFSEMARRIRHCERSGKQLPVNADEKRQHLNNQLFPGANGPVNAFRRWRERHGKKTVMVDGQPKEVDRHIHKYGVLAVEIFMGMSPGADEGKSVAELKKWVKDSVAWVEKEFGGKANIIAGATNFDERTPHVHVVVIPIDAKGRLNCRHFLGGADKLRALQTSYAKAVASHKLERGLAGSRRKYIPQQTLQEWNNRMGEELETACQRLDKTLDELHNVGAMGWAASKQSKLAEINAVFTETKNSLSHSFQLAQEVILARRDAQERAKILEVNNATDATVAKAMKEAEEIRQQAQAAIVAAKQEAANTVAEGKKEAEIVTQRADEVLKQNAALVRGLDLVPLARDILALEPAEKDSVFTFADANILLQISGRKFEDTRNPKCKGAGAIDLVKSLTGRNFKEAVEYLLPRHSAAVLAADAAGIVSEQIIDDIAAIKAPQPRVLTIQDVPPQIWKPMPQAWEKLRDKLVAKHQFDSKMLQNFWEREMLWAVSDSVLAVARPDLEDESKKPALRGVTLLDIDSPALVPRVLAPDQGGVFWVGNSLSKTDTIVGVANPLEALAYREIFLMDRQQKSLSDPAQPLPPAPMIVSLDAEFPTIAMFERIKQARKKSEKFDLATNTTLRNNELAEKAPLLYGANGQLLDWVTINILGDYAVDNSLTDQPPQLAWTRLMAEKIQARERDPQQKKQY